MLTPQVPRWSHRAMPYPGTEDVTTLLTNSNGEDMDGSSNKTPHIVVHVQASPLVAHTLQILRASCRWKQEGGRPREHRHSTLRRKEIQGLVVPGRQALLRRAASQAAATLPGLSGSSNQCSGLRSL